jgi:hypothetical protein
MSHQSPVDAPIVADAAAGYEHRDVNATMVVILSLVCILLIVVFAVGLDEYFRMTRDKIIQETVLSVPDAKLVEINAKATAQLTTPAVVDQAQGIYRIPIAAAMEQLAAEHAKP